MSKFYCVYLAWPKWEVMPSNAEGYDKLPRYPRDFARVRVYDNPGAQLECLCKYSLSCFSTFPPKQIQKKKLNKKLKTLKINLKMKNG